MSGRIPGLNYTITHSTDRLLRQQNYIEDEIITTRKLTFGHPDFITPSYGIVASTNPGASVAGGSDPLAVSVNATDPYSVDVNPGLVVFRSGSYVEIHEIVRGIPLADTALEVPNVIYIRFMLASGDPAPNFYMQTVVEPYTYRYGDKNNEGIASDERILIGSMTVDAWNSLAPSVLDDYCALAIATVQTVTDPITGNPVTQLSIDHSRNSYSFNRPWYSNQDIEHRNSIGTGTVSATNPHGTGPDDLTIGDMTMFDLYLDHGVILAKDKNIAKIPGYVCTSAITTVLSDDASGSVTGFPNAAYIELPYFPIVVGRVWIEPNLELPAFHVPETNRVVFPTVIPPAGNTIKVRYTRVTAAEPTLANNTVFSTSGPAENELIIAGGQGHTSLSTTEETFADAGTFPMRYDLFIDANGNVLKTPQVVYCRKKLDSIGASDTFTITPYGPARLMVGLVDASSAASMEVKVKIYGTDENNTNIDEEFTFNASNWNNPSPLPYVFTPSDNSIQFGSLVFSTLDKVSIVSRTDDGPNSAIMVWMLHTPEDTYTKLKGAAHIASVDWDGTRMSSVYDKRIVATTIKDYIQTGVNIRPYKHLIQALGGGNATIYVDDFMAPKYHSLMTEKEIVDEANNGVIPTLVKPFSAYGLSKFRNGLSGIYRSITFPVFSGSGKEWRVTLLGADRTVDPWFNPIIYFGSSNGIVWFYDAMTAVPGVDNTYSVSLSYVPDSIRLYIVPGNADGIIIYG